MYKKITLSALFTLILFLSPISFGINDVAVSNNEEQAIQNSNIRTPLFIQGLNIEFLTAEAITK